LVTGVWQYKASFAARDAREEVTDGLQAGGGLGTLPDGWSFVEATAVAVDAQDNVWVF